MSAVRLPPSATALGAATEPVGVLLGGVVSGSPPPVDGAVEVVPQPPGPVAGILAFGGHHVVAADVDPAWVHRHLEPWDMTGPTGPRFVGALADRLGVEPDNLDMVLWAPADPGPPPIALRSVDADPSHPRIERALRYRRELRLFETDDGMGLLILGRGLSGRWEAAFEVHPDGRGRGIGRALVSAARSLVPLGEPLFVEVAPGNVASVRTVLAAGGFTLVGAEILFATG